MINHRQLPSAAVRRALAEALVVVAGTLFFLGLSATLGLPGDSGSNQPPATALAETTAQVDREIELILSGEVRGDRSSPHSVLPFPAAVDSQ